jgi:indolepyruvate ferredoxin oxidoreductase beta subunit
MGSNNNMSLRPDSPCGKAADQANREPQSTKPNAASNILLSGVGGQGILLAAKVLANAAIQKGKFVRTSETIGMAQRGGSVMSHVRIGERVHCPTISKGKADLIISFEILEALRALPYLKEGGNLLSTSTLIAPASIAANKKDDTYTPAALAEKLSDFHRLGRIERLEIIDVEQACKELGNSKVANIVMLGQAARLGILPFTPEELELAVKKSVNPKFLGLNLKALKFPQHN